MAFIWEGAHETLGKPEGVDREGKESLQVYHRAGYRYGEPELNGVGKGAAG